jgi:Druantia protein DruA
VARHIAHFAARCYLHPPVADQASDSGAIGEAGNPTRIDPALPKVALDQVFELVTTTDSSALEDRLRGWARRQSRGREAWRLRASGTALVLADLVQQGWRLGVERGELWVFPPVVSRATVRSGLLAGKTAQLQQPSVISFLRSMEAPRAFAGRRVSVLDLVDDGASLAVELQRASAISEPERLWALRRVIHPQIEFALPSQRCSETGLPLVDVWRYFRHSWTLEYRPTPGRTILVLVRNAARPNRPVMGIASLASALPQFRPRDLFIGWTSSEVKRRLEKEPEAWRRLRAALLRTLEDVKRSVRYDDLAPIDSADADRTLDALAQAALKERENSLRERQQRVVRGEPVAPAKNLPRLADGGIDWTLASETPLFKAKRARTLAAVVRAHRELAASPEGPLSASELSINWPRLEPGITAGLTEVKKVGLASRVLDVNVCGAVPPYRQLLVGKLTALLLGSAEIRHQYQRRYGEQPSEIASQMAGEPIVRAADLCLLTTTSLYGRSSQYNRLSVEVDTSDGRVPLKWHELNDTTRGFGTVHFSAETVVTLRRIVTTANDWRNVSNVFGEGHSPRLRQVREGLDELGLNSDQLLQHRGKRRVYVLPLGANATDALLFNASVDAPEVPLAQIAEAWSKRWLSPRIRNLEVLDSVAASGRNTLLADLRPSGPQRDLLESGAVGEPPTAKVKSRRRRMARVSRVGLVQDLYRAGAACSDGHDASTIDFLHIATAVDDFVLTQVLEGRVLFVTGSPGDGKTHLAKKLAPRIDAGGEAKVCLDANTLSDESLARLVDDGLESRSGTIIAINEGVLVNLTRAAEHRPWAGGIRRQLLSPYVYRSQAGNSSDRILVVDLTFRNNLAQSTVTEALERLLSVSAPCDGCPHELCPGMFNLARLEDADVRSRLILLLDAVARTGFHATMRDLHAFLSFVLFGGMDCERVKSSSDLTQPYWENAFVGGVGPLFDRVRSFDPSRVTMPLLDDALWRHADDAADWRLPHGLARGDRTSDLETRRLGFIGQKRRALFEHRSGRDLISASDPVTALLVEVLQEPGRGLLKLVRLLNQFYDQDDDRTDALVLWTTHRFDARPNRYAAARWSIPTSELEILLPRLPTELEQAFPAFVPDHALLCLRDAPPDVGLRVDWRLLQALYSAQQGLPATFRSGEPGARVSAFFDRLAVRAARNAPHEFAEIRCVDMETGTNLRAGIDVVRRVYLRS